MAARLSSSNAGPFPLVHPNLHHTHILADKGYNVKGVIDWEGTCTLPWELVQSPHFLSTVPAAMDSPLNYDNDGEPLDPKRRERWEDQEAYVELVAEAEMDFGADSKLSDILADQRAQDLACALRSYLDFGDLNLYTDDVHSEPVPDGYPGKLRARAIRDYLVPGKMGPFTNVLRAFGYQPLDPG
jgi:hypothetical protein